VQAAGWRPDPDGSPRWRWWDGSAWTDRTVAMDAASAARPPDTAGPGAPPTELPAWARPTWRARHRAVPTASGALGAIAGVFVVVAAAVVISDHFTATGGRGIAVLVSLVVAAAGSALAVSGVGPTRTSGTAMLAGGILLLTTSALGDALDPASAVPVFTAAVVWAAAYVAGPTRSHALFLGLAVAGLWAGLLVEVAVPDPGAFGWSDPTGEVVVVSTLVGGIAVLAAAGADRARLAGVAAPLLAVGVPILAVGAYAALADDPREGGVLALLAGAGVLVVGGVARRRFTTWAGAVLAGVGAIALAGDTFQDVGPNGIALVFAFLAVAFAGAAFTVAQRLGDPLDEAAHERLSTPGVPAAAVPATGPPRAPVS
jgi:MFS family permease